MFQNMEVQMIGIQNKQSSNKVLVNINYIQLMQLCWIGLKSISNKFSIGLAQACILSDVSPKQKLYKKTVNPYLLDTFFTLDRPIVIKPNNSKSRGVCVLCWVVWTFEIYFIMFSDKFTCKLMLTILCRTIFILD